MEEDQQHHLAKVAESHAQIWLSLQEQQDGRYDVEQLQVLLTDEKHQFATKTDELAKVTEALASLESQLEHAMVEDNGDKEKKEQWVKINEQVAEKEKVLETTRQRQPPPPVEVKKTRSPGLADFYTFLGSNQDARDATNAT